MKGGGGGEADGKMNASPPFLRAEKTKSRMWYNGLVQEQAMLMGKKKNTMEV